MSNLATNGKITYLPAGFNWAIQQQLQREAVQEKAQLADEPEPGYKEKAEAHSFKVLGEEIEIIDILAGLMTMGLLWIGMTLTFAMVAK